MAVLGAGPAATRPLGLCVLCGLPAAGKSSLAQSLGRDAEWDCVRISYDDIIPEDAFRQPLEMSCWKWHRQQLLVYIESFLLSLRNGSPLCAPAERERCMWPRFARALAEQGFVSFESVGAGACHPLLQPRARRPLYIVLDDNFYYQSMRYAVYQLARKYSVGFCQLFVDCSLDSCLQRNRHRDRPVPDATIMLMAEKIQVPNAARNLWEKNSIILRNEGPDWEDSLKVKDLLCMALENPMKECQDNANEKESARSVTAASVLHQADQALRKMISESMKMAKESVPAREMKTLAEKLSKLKSQLLEDVRRGSFQDQTSIRQGTEVQDIVLLFHQKKEKMLQGPLDSQQREEGVQEPAPFPAADVSCGS